MVEPTGAMGDHAYAEGNAVTLPVSQESSQNYGDVVAVLAIPSSAADMALTVASAP